MVSEVDADAAKCEARWAELEKTGRAYGEGPLETKRELFLGRARGAVTLFTKVPAMGADQKPLTGIANARVARLVSQLKRDKPALRKALLREGYVYTDDPEDAFELDGKLKLVDLFDEPKIVLERGEETFALERLKKQFETVYVHTDGPRKGKPAQVLFGDRVRLPDEAAQAPLHRDLLSFARREGFDTMDVVRVGEHSMLAKLHYGDTNARVVIASTGAKLSISCVAEKGETRAKVASYIQKNKWRMRAEARMRDVVTDQIDEALPFDRPRDEKGPDKDGMLRPHWNAAYMHGLTSFSSDGGSYPVYLPDGRAQPPQVCADFVLDTYERAAGSWFAPRGETPKHFEGRLDISSFGIENRRGVLGLKKFMEERTELFDTRVFKGKERIPFGLRQEFFTYLLVNAKDFRAGDILAIQGVKRDNRVHQHAILLEYVDPITGFPAGLADQMHLPRRRTWEGIMAEAPRRSLLFRARPLDAIFKPLDDGADRANPTIATVASK